LQHRAAAVFDLLPQYLRIETLGVTADDHDTVRAP
jgi:hypothetical protein